jgi:hypothetical protein
MFVLGFLLPGVSEHNNRVGFLLDACEPILARKLLAKVHFELFLH